MKNLIKSSAIILAFALPATGAFANGGHSDKHAAKPAAEMAHEKQVTFTIDKMTCAMCPITVRKAMEKVDGVKSVVTDYDAKTAVVVFNPEKANVKAIAKASEMAGYPATLQDHKHEHKGE